MQEKDDQMQITPLLESNQILQSPFHQSYSHPNQANLNSFDNQGM